MKFTRNAKAISKLLLILLLLLTMIVGAILSYLWVMGYVINLGIAVPEKTVVSIANVTFLPQDTSYFNVTLLNPSYSPLEANVTEIVVSTMDDTIHDMLDVRPQLPHVFKTGRDETFRCVWDWANYTGETLKIFAYIEDGSGSTFEAETPLMDLEITDLSFNSAISVTHFNVTVQNGATSVTDVNITGVTIDRESIPADRLSISLPYDLKLDESVAFKCMWNWTKFQDRNVTVGVNTLQGYTAYRTHLTPKPVNLIITKVLFNVTDTSHFNLTIHNSVDSPNHVNITGVSVTMENGTTREIARISPSLSPSYPLMPGANATFTCSWNWTEYREKNATVTVYTLQNFTVSSTQTTTPRVLLEITKVIFGVADASHFNVTVRNSDFSVEEYVNITRVTVVVDNETPGNITVEPQIALHSNTSVTFKSVWNWAEYWTEEVSIAVHTIQGYSAYTVESTPSPVMISDVLFNLSDTSHFNLTVQNSEFFSTYVLITSITATVEGGDEQDVTVVAPTRLPYVLHRSESVKFRCFWDWTAYKGKIAKIEVETLEGYEVSYSYEIPSS